MAALLKRYRLMPQTVCMYYGNEAFTQVIDARQLEPYGTLSNFDSSHKQAYVSGKRVGIQLYTIALPV
jgi:hypothetical protein